MADFNVSLHGASTFFLTGELDMATAKLLTGTIGAAIARGGPITLDMSQMTFIDSSGVKAMLDAAGALPSGCLVLHGVHDGIQKILDAMDIEASPNLHIVPCDVPV